MVSSLNFIKGRVAGLLSSVIYLQYLSLLTQLSFLILCKTAFFFFFLTIQLDWNWLKHCSSLVLLPNIYIHTYIDVDIDRYSKA